MTAGTSDVKVVVTGLGATTPLGGDVASTWSAILAGTSGVRTLPYDWVAKYDLPVTIGANIHTPADQVLTKVEVRRLDPNAQYAIIASREAWQDAGAPEIDPERLGVVIGTGIGGVWTLIDQRRARAGFSRSRCPCSCPTRPAAMSRST